MRQTPSIVVIEYTKPAPGLFRGRAETYDFGWSGRCRIRYAAWPNERYRRYAERNTASYQRLARRAAERRALADGACDGQGGSQVRTEAT